MPQLGSRMCPHTSQWLSPSCYVLLPALAPRVSPLGPWRLVSRQDPASKAQLQHRAPGGHCFQTAHLPCFVPLCLCERKLWTHDIGSIFSHKLGLRSLTAKPAALHRSQRHQAAKIGRVAWGVLLSLVPAASQRLSPSCYSLLAAMLRSASAIALASVVSSVPSSPAGLTTAVAVVLQLACCHAP